MDYRKLKEFYSGKKVFVTGHTGFKGSWMCCVLKMLGAEVYGYALNPDKESLFKILNLGDEINSTYADIRDFSVLEEAYVKASPDVVIHLAAQPLVRESYNNPRYTFETNVMGTVNILECMRLHSGVRSFLNVTTDKVYENSDLRDHAFSEDEKLDGYDPYSNSKSCSELVTHSYKKSLFDGKGAEAVPAISTARAGNVIGGGDFAKDRIIPDCVRAAINKEEIRVRNPLSVRPYQHVLEPVFAYLMIAMRQAQNPELSGYYNVGPRSGDAMTTGELADEFVRCWGDGAAWKDVSEVGAPHEASYLQLDCTKMQKTFSWEPTWNAGKAVEETVLWYKAWSRGEDMRGVTKEQIERYARESR